MYIPRHLENVIKRISKNKSAIFLSGPRKVGKEAMLKHLLPNTNFITLAKPLLRQNAIENPSMFFDINKPPIIVDEIQKVPKLFDYIKLL